MILAFAGAVGTASGEDLRFAPQVPMPATFTFKASVETEGDRLLLGQLADCTGVDVICAEAYGVDLGSAPAPGKILILTETRLKELLAREWDEAAIVVKAPQGLRVTAGFREMDADAVQAELTRAFAAAFPEGAAYRVEVTRLQILGKHKLRPVAHTVEFPAVAGLPKRNEDWLVKNLTGAQRLDVRYVPEGDPAAFETHQVSAALVLRKRLPVAARNMQHGDIFSESDLAEDFVELGRGSQRFSEAAREILGRRLKRPLALGAPIQPGMLEVPLVVRLGQTVRLLVHTGGLTVTSHVKALGNGTYGQGIEAVSLTTKKHMRVKVIDSTTVEYLE